LKVFIAEWKGTVLQNKFPTPGYPFAALHGLSHFYFLSNNIIDIKITLTSTRSLCVAYAISLTKREGQ